MNNLNDCINYKIEKECFFKWVNYVFHQNKQPLINNINYDLRDGAKLLSIIQILSKNNLKTFEENSTNKKRNNIDRCLDILQSHDIDTDDIKAVSILDGNLKSNLSLIWKIIMFWQIKRTCELESLSEPEVKAVILQWCNKCLKKYGLSVSNFGTDWRNGLAFNALLHSLDPEGFDFDEIKDLPPKQALAHAFKFGLEKYGIPQLLEPLDVDQDSPDSRCVFLYIAFIYEKSVKSRGALSSYVTNLPEYSSRLDNLISCLKSIQSQLCKDKIIPSEIDDIKDEFNCHEDFITSLTAQQTEIFDTLKAGQFALQNAGDALSKDEKGSLLERMKGLNALWESVRTDTLEYQARLQKALDTIQKEQMANFETWLDGMEKLRNNLGSDHELSFEQGQNLKEEFDKGTALIKPLSNLLVIVDSEEDQGYDAFEEKLTSLRNRYTKISSWAENLKNQKGEPILVPVFKTETSDKISPEGKTSPIDLNDKFKAANDLKDWNTIALSKLEILANYHANPSAWKEMGEDPKNLPSLEDVKHTFQSKENQLKDMLDEYNKNLATHTPDLDFKKQLENVERTMNYIKYKIEKLEAANLEFPPGGSSPPSYKKMKVEPSHSFKGRPLAAAPLLSPIDMADSSSPTTTILTPVHEGSTSPPPCPAYTPPPPPALLSKPGPAFNFARVPSIEITSDEPDENEGGNKEAKRDENVPSVEHILSRKRESLSVPSEFPELTIPAVESEQPGTVHLSKEPYASHDIERIHIDIYDINEMLKELEAWFMHAKEQAVFTSASQTKEFSDAIENCSTKLDNIKALWPKIEETRNQARQAVSQSEDETYQNILHDANNMIHRWEGLFEQTNQYFETLVNMLEAYHYQSFQEPLTSLNRWLDNVQSNLIAESNKYNNPDIMQENLKKLQEIQQTIHGQSPNLTSIRNIWEEKMSDENFHFSLRDKFQKDIDEVVQKFENVCQLGDESSEELEKRLVFIRNYLDEVKVLRSWMDDLNKILESDQDDLSNAPKLKEEELKGLQDNLDLLRPNLDNINKVTPKILENCDIDFAKKIKEEVFILNELWKKIIAQSDKEKTWFNFDGYMQYLDRVEKQLDVHRAIETERDIDNAIETLKNLKKDLNEKKYTFYNDLPSGLFPEGTIPDKEEKELNSKYCKLIEKIDSMIDFYQTSQQDYLDFKANVVKTNQEIDAINLKLQAASNDQSVSSTPGAKSLSVSLNRRLSGLKDKAQILEKNKIFPELLNIDIQDLSKKVNDVNNRLDKECKQMTQRDLPPPRGQQSPSDEGSVDDVGARLDESILKLQEWIVHEDILIMSHMEGESPDLSPEEYAQMVKDFQDKDALFRSIEKNINLLPDRAQACEMGPQLKIMKTRFKNVQATFEDFKMPPQIAPRLKRIRLSLSDIKDDVEELKVSATKGTDIREQLDRCLRDCYRLGDVKTTLEQLNKDLPDLLKEENPELKREIEDKLEALKKRYNEIGDKANDKKAVLQTALEVGDKFDKLNSPLKEWIQTTENDLDNRRKKVNPNNLAKETNNLKQLEMEFIEKDTDLDALNSLLDDCKIKFSNEPEKFEAYELAAQETRLQMERLRAKIKEDRDYYKNLEDLNDRLKGQVENIRAFIHKGEQKIATCKDADPETFQSLRTEMEESRLTMTQAQSTGSELIGLSDNFRTTTLSELASLKKQFEDIAQQIEVKCKTNISPSKLPQHLPTRAVVEQQIKPQGLEQDISFGIARLNDFAQQLEPSMGRITPIPIIDPYSDKFQRPLDSRIRALKLEYQATQDLMNGLKDRMDKSDGANKLVNQDFDQIYHKWENSVKPMADSKISEYEKLASCWKKFVSDGKALDTKLTELNQSEDFPLDKYDTLLGMPKHDLGNLKGEAAMFKNTELEPLSDTLINTLEDRLSKMSIVLARSSSLAQYPKTPPPTPSYQSGGGSVVKLPTNQTYDCSSNAAVATKLSTTSAPPPIDEEQPEPFMSRTDKKLSMQHGKGKATSSSDRIDYSSDPYEFLWEISNIQEMVKRMIKDLKDPILFGDSEISKNPENYPARRERLMSIKETLKAISPGIEGSESHKNDLIKYNEDQIVSKQIEDSLDNLKTDWLILNQVYNDKLNLIEPEYEKGSVRPSAENKEPQRPLGSELREAAEIATLPDKFNLVDQEPPEAIELVSRLQDIALWLQKCENELKKPIPLFNESALRELKSAYKMGEAGFPSKLKVLKDSQSTLDQIKGDSSLQSEKVERIQNLIEQAKDKYQAISKDYVNKRKEIDDQYNRVFHFDQQLDGLSFWLNSTRQNIEKSLPVLKEDDIKDIHAKLDKRQPDYDQINYNFIQLANEGSRYNELYDIDDYQIPDVWRDSVKNLNADWDFIKSIDPKNIQKTVASEELQADQPNIQAQWPKVQQEMYQMNDKLNTIENYLTSRIVNIINIPEIYSEVMSLKESLKEVKNLKGHIIQIEKMENNVLLEKAGYKDEQIKEVKGKCDSMIGKMKDRIIVLNAMRQDALKYDYLYTAICEWLRVNSPILKELVDCPDYSKITEEELRKNHVYLEQKVPTYNKLSQDIQMLSKKMVNTYSHDDPSSINSETSNIYKLWYMLQRGEEIGPKISLTTLGRSPTSIQRQQQQTMPMQKSSIGELTPKDLKEFRNQLESFKVALTGEESALEVMKSEIGQALKDKDEAHIKVWLEQVKEFQRDLEEHRLGYNVLNENGKKVLDDPSLVKSKEEVLALKYKLEDINKKWEQLKTQSNTLRNSLEEHFDSQDPITLAIEEGLGWVIDRRNHLEAMKPLRGDLNGLRHQLEEVRQFNSRVEAKRDPAIQDILKNGQAYLAEIGYYKALTGEYPLSPIKLEEGKKLENELINLQSRWTELLDSGVVWENTISQMLSKVEDLNMNMVDIDITLKEKRAMLDAMDRNKDAFKPNFQALSDDVEELKVRIYDLNGEAAGLLAQGLHLAKENDKRLQKLNDDWQYLHDLLNQSLASSDATITKGTAEQDTSLPRLVDVETMPETSPELAKANVPSSISGLYQPKNAIMSYRPSRDMSYMVKDPTLPPMWEKALTENGVPYYINLETEVTYWDHPKMMEIMNALTETNYVRYSAYRTAMKLRIIQKRLFLYLLKLNSAIDLFDNHNLRGKNEDYIRVPQISSISRSLYEKLNQDNPDIVTNVPLSSDLYVDWLLDVYDSSRTGKIRVLSMKVATIILCRAHLVDKYKYLIQLVADANGNVTMEKLALLLKDMLMIPKYLGEVASFGGSDPGPSVASCSEHAARASKPTSSPRPRSTSPTHASEPRAAGVGGSLRMGGSPFRDGATIRAIDFVTWMNRDPQSVVWLPVLYRIAAAETARHQSKCNICKAYPIVGFRYRCLKCLNFDICQQCFFLGKKYKSHKPSHPLHEYSTPTTTGEDVKDLTKTIKNKLFRSKRYYRLHPRLGYLPLEMGTTQRSRQAYGGDSSDDEEHRPLVAGPGGADDSYRASASPQSTLNHIPESNGYTGGDKIGFIDHSFINAPETHKGVAEEISLANLDEHTLINKYCQDLSNNPSPSLSKISLNTDDDNKIYFDKRIRDLELEHITLKREYERLKNATYDPSITHCINNDHEYSPNLRDIRTSFPIDDGEIDTSINRFERLYTTSSPYNDISYQHLKTLDNLGLDDSSHPYIRLADCAWSPNPNLNPLYSVANNLNKAVGELVTAISSTNPSTLQNPKKWQKIYGENSDGASAPLTPVH